MCLNIHQNLNPGCWVRSVNSTSVLCSPLCSYLTVNLMVIYWTGLNWFELVSGSDVKPWTSDASTSQHSSCPLLLLLLFSSWSFYSFRFATAATHQTNDRVIRVTLWSRWTGNPDPNNLKTEKKKNSETVWNGQKKLWLRKKKKTLKNLDL